MNLLPVSHHCVLPARAAGAFIAFGLLALPLYSESPATPAPAPARAKEDAPKAATLAIPTDAELRKKLTPLQYAVTRESETERPFQNEYWNKMEEGIYVDVISGEPLFSSKDKFQSDCGWPAFSKPISASELKDLADRTHGMDRTEVRAKLSDAHLGHVFTDGPRELGGLRYCINSASLRFIPRDKMAEAGYGAYLKLLGPDAKTGGEAKK